MNIEKHQGKDIRRKVLIAFFFYFLKNKIENRGSWRESERKKRRIKKYFS